MNTSLQQRIEVAMRQKGATQKQIADACGIAVPSVNGWVKGKTKTLKAETAIKAAQFLGVNAEWLAEGRGPMLASEMANAVLLTAEEHRLLHSFQQLGEKDRLRLVAEVEYKARLAEIESLSPKERLSA